MEPSKEKEPLMMKLLLVIEQHLQLKKKLSYALSHLMLTIILWLDKTDNHSNLQAGKLRFKVVM